MHLSGFEVNTEIGSGGAHRWFRARRVNDRYPVLLRMPCEGEGSQALRALFEREVEICRDLDDSNGWLKALQLFEMSDGAVLVLDDAPGLPLEYVLAQRDEPLPLVTVLKVASELAKTLSALHRNDVIHRDLRPANILYDASSERLTLTGLGCASRVPRESWRIRAPDRLEGEPAYLAPEATGRLNRQLDYRADLYSLGVVLFELLTGQTPFRDDDAAALVYAHIALEPPDPVALRPEIPAVVSSIVGKLLAKAAEDRYQSGRGLELDLKRCLEDLEMGDEVRAFALGDRDVPEHFELPQKLYGREQELRWLEDALATAASGTTVVRLVTGYSGVGKTSLIEELRLAVVRQRGRFVSGTFGSGSSNTPYDGILTALRALVKQQLGFRKVAEWGRRLTKALGSHLGVLTEAFPELLDLVGEAPPIPEARPENARGRFYGCIRRFLSTLEKDRPLVFFLDDVQWIDPASLELVANLVEGDQPFLLLGAYRDNLVGEDHLLSRGLSEFSARGVDVEFLRLTPLARPAVSRLVAETLRLSTSEVAPLAELIYRKTAGNPFFVRAFLGTLHQHRLLRLSGGTPVRWTWDLEAIASLEATENVVELIAHQLTELPLAVRQTLAAAAVLGKEVDAEILAVACEAFDSDGQTETILIEACRQGLMLKGSEYYAFVHDRVREGAYELLGDEQRADVHLRVGRLLRDRFTLNRTVAGPVGKDPRGIFDVADHLNQAAHLIADPGERRDLVRLNAEAGRRARASGAFPAAFEYLRHALEIQSAEASRLSVDLWQEDYELTRSLYGEAAEAASLAGEFEAAEQFAVALSSNARELLDAMPAYETRISMLYAERDEDAAIRLALDVLSRFGVEIPMNPSTADLEPVIADANRAVEDVLATVARHGIAELPTLSDPKQIVVSRLLGRTVMIAGWHRIEFLRFAACRLAKLTAAHGVSLASPMAYVLMAEVRCGQLDDIVGGHRVGELGLELARHLGFSDLEAVSQVLFEVLVGGRVRHPAALRKRFRELLKRNLESGELLAAGAAGFQHSIAGLLAGHELRRVEEAARDYHSRVHGFGQLMMAHAIEGVMRLAGVLLGRGTVAEAVDIADVTPGAARSVRFRQIGPEMLVRFLLRQRSSAQRVARESLAIPHGTVPIVPFDFYRCLIFSEAGGDESALTTCLERLEKQADAAPRINRHKLDLVKAYVQLAAGEVAEALTLCERAIAGARSNEFPHEETMARELAARLCLELSRESEAETHLRAAVAGYRRWGAQAKIDQLVEEFPDWIASQDDPATSLDVTSLERAQNALASEIDLDRLLRRLMTLLLQNAGARRGFLLSDAGEGIIIEASGVVGEIAREDVALEDHQEIASTVVRYVARTGETVVLDGMDDDSRFASDTYLQRARPRSVLCFPLQHREQTVEIVYLENDQNPDVFSPERSAAVRLLASHATVALENARLLLSLKQEVETRRRAEADLAALKDRLQAENVYLQEEIRSHFEEIVGNSDAMRGVLYKVEQVAATDATVLILGETGTGKELIARALHRLSNRRERPLVKVNCAALPTTLIESELFGHEKGAFTGAISRKAGRFELADSGTLFLDEIGDLPLELQAKLLRVLQEGEFERLGGAKTTKVDVRIIAATNRDLEAAMAEGTFRSDLYYRLTVFPVELPPLRKRYGDVPLLAHYFVDRKRTKLGRAVEKIPQEAIDRLVGYSWPGNVRELENVIERALILSLGDTLRLDESFGAGKEASSAGPVKLEDLEREHIRSVLESCDWKVKGEGNAAERLGLKPPTLRNRMKKFGIVRPVA